MNVRNFFGFVFLSFSILACKPSHIADKSNTTLNSKQEKSSEHVSENLEILKIPPMPEVDFLALVKQLTT